MPLRAADWWLLPVRCRHLLLLHHQTRRYTQALFRRLARAQHTQFNFRKIRRLRVFRPAQERFRSAQVVLLQQGDAESSGLMRTPFDKLRVTVLSAL